MRDALKVALVLGCAAASLPAIGQNFDAEPNYGTVTLNSGFTPDPNVIAVSAGGSRSASSAASHCNGFISDRPDVRLHYTSGSYPLIISVASSADTTLVVNGPNGTWYCDDDGGVNGSNPALRFNSPQSGRYEIWIGTYRSGALQSARLHLSEISSQ